MGTKERPETRLLRISVNRARLHAGRSAIRVETHDVEGPRKVRLRHGRSVRGRGWVLRTQRYGRRWFVYLYTTEAVEVLS